MSIKLQNRHTPIRQLKIISFNLVYDLRLYNLLWPTRELKSVHEIDISNHFSGSESVRFVLKKSDQRGTCLQLNVNASLLLPTRYSVYVKLQIILSCCAFFPSFHSLNHEKSLLITMSKIMSLCPYDNSKFPFMCEVKTRSESLKFVCKQTIWYSG